MSICLPNGSHLGLSHEGMTSLAILFLSGYRNSPSSAVPGGWPHLATAAPLVPLELALFLIPFMSAPFLSQPLLNSSYCCFWLLSMCVCGAG